MYLIENEYHTPKKIYKPLIVLFLKRTTAVVVPVDSPLVTLLLVLHNYIISSLLPKSGQGSEPLKQPF